MIHRVTQNSLIWNKPESKPLIILRGVSVGTDRTRGICLQPLCLHNRFKIVIVTEVMYVCIHVSARWYKYHKLTKMMEYQPCGLRRKLPCKIFTKNWKVPIKIRYKFTGSPEKKQNKLTKNKTKKREKKRRKSTNCKQTKPLPSMMLWVRKFRCWTTCSVPHPCSRIYGVANNQNW